MRTPPRTLVGSAAAVAAALTAVALVAPATAQSASSASVSSTSVSTTRLTGDVAAGNASSQDLGATAGSKNLTLVLGLSRPDAAAEAAFTKALYDPTSAEYHHYLTPTTFAARFGVPQATYAAAVGYATAHGMTVLSSTAAHDEIQLTGTVAQAEATFGVTIHNFRSSISNPYLNKDYVSNTTGPLVPAGLGVIGVLGLSNERVAKVDSAKGTLHAVAPAQSMCQAGECLGLTTPEDLWDAYDQPSGNMGQGSQMAIFGEGQTDDIINDLRGFETEHALRRMPITVVHTDGPTADYSDDAGAEEWNIDTQSSTGMSPLADREVLYFGDALSDASVLGVFNSWANDATGPMQASASYGECEELPTNAADGGVAGEMPTAGAAYTVMSEQTLASAVMMGKTLFSSSGDTGAGCPVLPTSTNGAAPQGVPSPNYPGDSPNAVSVGGTVLYTTGTTPNVRSIESSWNYTGGGRASSSAEPSYQTPVGTVITGVCAGDPGGATMNNVGLPCRGVPDVAMQSGDIATNGYGITVAGANDQAGGGTSLASPMMMGTWTRIQAAAANKAGFANEEFYKVGTDATKDDAAFFDVGGTTNTQPGMSVATTSFGPYTNQPRSAVDPSGWDYLSGLGVPDVSVLMKDVAGTLAPATTVVQPGAPVLPVGAVANGCLPSGIVTDPAGDANEVIEPMATPAPSQDDLDILTAYIRYSAATPTLTFNILVTNLGTGTLGENFRYIFSYDGVEYTAESSRASGGGTPAFSVLELATGTGGMNSTILSGLTGTFDATTNTVSLVMPLAAFNTAAKPTTPLGVGGSLTETIDAQRDTGVVTATADEATGACPFIVGGEATTTEAVTVTTTTTTPTGTTTTVTAPVVASTLASTGVDTRVPLGAAGLVVLALGAVRLRRRRA